MSQTLKPQEHALRATQSNASKIKTWLYAHKYLIELYSLVRKAKLAHTQIFAIWSSHLFILSNFQSVLIVSNMANWISTKLLTIRFQYFLIFWKDLEKPPDCEEGQNLPDCKGGHDKHLDDDNCRIEGKSLKQLLVDVQSHPFNSLQEVD